MCNAITICFCMISSIYVIIKDKKVYSPVVVFNAIWFLILSLESLHLFGLCVSENRIYLMIMLGVISFNMGFYLWSYRRKNHRIVFSFGKRSISSLNQTDYIIRYNLLYLIGLICVCYYLVSAVTTIKLLLAGANMGEIRSIVQNTVSDSGDTFFSKIINAINVLIIVPGSGVVQVTGAMDFWFGKKDKKLFFLAIVLACVSSLGEGGRTSLVNMAIYMLIGYLLSEIKLRRRKMDNKMVRKKRRRIIIFATSLMIVFLAWFTLSRVGNTLVKNLYLYFSMQPYMFNLWANAVDRSKLYGYSEASLNGFSFALLYIIKNMFGIDFPKHWKGIYELIRATDSEWQIITTISTKANAYVSAFWFLYLDARIIGIVIGMVLYGAYLAHAFADATKYTNIKTATLYGFIFQGMVYVFIRFPFSNIYYAISYLMIILFTFKKNTRGRELC